MAKAMPIPTHLRPKQGLWTDQSGALAPPKPLVLSLGGRESLWGAPQGYRGVPGCRAGSNWEATVAS